jgi:hypothetical protein
MSPDNDVERMKEFVYRSSEQLIHLTERTDAIDSKVDGLIRDVIKIKADIENHPILCPINTARIREIVNDELVKLPDKKLNKNVKMATIALALFSLLNLGLTLFAIIRH